MDFSRPSLIDAIFYVCRHIKLHEIFKKWIVLQSFENHWSSKLLRKKWSNGSPPKLPIYTIYFRFEKTKTFPLLSNIKLWHVSPTVFAKYSVMYYQIFHKCHKTDEIWTKLCYIYLRAYKKVEDWLSESIPTSFQFCLVSVRTKSDFLSCGWQSKAIRATPDV